MRTSRWMIAVVALSLALTLPMILGTRPARTAGTVPTDLTETTFSTLATVITVTTTEDELNSDGDCSLREAIQAANTDTAVDACPAGSGNDIVSLPAYTYTLSIPSTDEDANVDGDLDITDDITLQGADAATTIIQAGTNFDNGIARVLHVLGGSELTVADVTIQYGLATGSSPHNRGGGIYVDGGTVTVTHSILYLNRADGSNSVYGGGIYNDGGTVIVADSTLMNNRVDYMNDGRGGGIYNSNGVVTLDNSVLYRNGVQNGFDGYGGGMYVDGGTVTIIDSTLDDNRVFGDSGSDGGGIYNSGGTVTLTNSTLSSNGGFGGSGTAFGGSIYNTSGGMLTITASTLNDNVAQGGWEGRGVGGGIYNSPSSTVLLTNSTLSGNRATDSDMGDPGRGGGIHNNGGTITLNSSTLSENEATNGGGIYDSGVVNVTNSIIANNVGGDCSGTITSNDHNIDSDNSCNLTQPHDQPNIDPKLEPLADNGGPTWTHALQNGSPAIDAGDCSGGTVTQDQRGAARPQGTACDVGAYEYGVLAVNDDYGTLEDTSLVVAAPGVLLNDQGANPLTAAVALSPTDGMLVFNIDGSFVYTPALNFNGVDGFAYMAGDGTFTDTATVSIIVAAVDDAPIAVNDAFTATEDVPLIVSAAGLLDNDSEVDGDPLYVIAATDGLSGTVAANADGSFAYTPTLNFYGADWFTYTVSDGTLTDTATVTITVTAANDAPIAIEDTYTTSAGIALMVIAPGVLGNDSDVEAESLTAILKTPPVSGTLTLNLDGSFVYVPTAGFVGVDQFVYCANDGSDDSESVTVTINVVRHWIYLPIVVSEFQ